MKRRSVRSVRRNTPILPRARYHGPANRTLLRGPGTPARLRPTACLLSLLQSLRLAQREARALKQCDHPCIIKLLDCFRSPSGRAYLVRRRVRVVRYEGNVWTVQACAWRTRIFAR